MEPIRKALSSPSDAALQQAAFSALLPNVKVIQNFYERSKEVAELVPILLGELSAPTALSSRPHLTYAFLVVLSKIHAIDARKMMCPGLQNDFSFYRRSVGKFTSQATVSETSAGQISMWIAESSPLTASLVSPLKKKLVADALSGPALGRLSTLCAWILSKNAGTPSLASRSDVALLATAMTASFVLLDRCAARGAFHPASGVQLKKVVSTLCALEGDNAEVREQCKNGIKYSTVHYKDATTPAYVEEIMQ